MKGGSLYRFGAMGRASGDHPRRMLVAIEKGRLGRGQCRPLLFLCAIRAFTNSLIRAVGSGLSMGK